MDTAHSFSHLPEALARAYRHWEARHAGETSASGTIPGLTIALSRQVGAAATAIAQRVGERLGWPVYDHELVEQIARQMKLRANLIDSVDERRGNWIRSWVEQFIGLPGVTESEYTHHLLETLASLAAHGECIIVGRGAAQVLPPASTLRVCLVAPLEQRIAFLSRQRGMTRQQAAQRIETSERERIRFVQNHFRKDPTDPGNYDLVLNVGRFSVDDCADLITNGLHLLRRSTDTGQAAGSAKGEARA
jgi:cytidylate kinase